MSALMRDWIRPAVCKQLDEALKDTDRDGNASITYSEDGTLLIHVTEGKAVQVNEVFIFPSSRDIANPLAVHQSCSSISIIGVRLLYSN
jgi:hypothetical protein